MWVLGAVGKGWAEAEAKKTADSRGIVEEFANQLRANPDWTVEDMKLARDAITRGRSSLLSSLPDDNRLGELAAENLRSKNWKQSGEVIQRRGVLQQELDKRYTEHMTNSSTGDPEKDYQGLLKIRDDFVKSSGIDSANKVWAGLRTLGTPSTGKEGSLYRYAKETGASNLTGRRATARSEWKSILAGMTDKTGAIDMDRWEKSKQQFKTTWGDRLGGDSVWNTYFRTPEQLRQVNKDISDKRIYDEQQRGHTKTIQARDIATHEQNSWLKNIKIFKDQEQAAKQTADDMGYEDEAAQELITRLSSQDITPITAQIASDELTSKWPTILSMLNASEGKIDSSALAKTLGFENEELVSMVSKLAEEKYNKEQSASISTSRINLEKLVKDSSEWAGFNSPDISVEEKLTRYRALAQMANMSNPESLTVDDMWQHLNVIAKGVFSKNRSEYGGKLYSEVATQRDAAKKVVNSEEYAAQVNSLLGIDADEGDRRFKNREPYYKAVRRAIQQLFHAGGTYYYDPSTVNHYIKALIDYAEENEKKLSGDGNTFNIATTLQAAAPSVFKAAQLEMRTATGTAPPLPQSQSSYIQNEAERKAAALVGPQYIDAKTYSESTSQALDMANDFVNEAEQMAKQLQSKQPATKEDYEAQIAPFISKTRQLQRVLYQLEAQIQSYVSMPGRFGGNIEDDNAASLRDYLNKIKEIQSKLDSVAIPGFEPDVTGRAAETIKLNKANSYNAGDASP